MPTILVRDPTLVERLRKLQPVPDDAFDGVIYELLKRAEAAGKPKLSGLDDLPRLVVEEVRKALDGRLTEMLKTALLPAISNLSIEIPVELNIKVKMRLEPVFDVAHEPNSSNNTSVDLDALERRAVEYLKQIGGCWEGSAYSLAKHIAGDVHQAVWALESRLRRRLAKRDGKICLPEAVAKEDDVVVAV